MVTWGMFCGPAVVRYGMFCGEIQIVCGCDVVT